MWDLNLPLHLGLTCRIAADTRSNMTDLVQTTYRVDEQLLADFDRVLAKTGTTRSVILRAAMERCVERDDSSWLLVPLTGEVQRNEK